MLGKCLRKIIQQLLLIFFSYVKDKEILPAYISKHNSTREKQIILFFIPNEEKEGWHYLAVKNYLHYYME